mmetsp:Transcript_4738/g.5855  ORF Transcript_4738/g.5855 Transcript_4738/m.5855 type:complete len:288 (-) Transcript_4738:923-1786(-)
MWPYSEDQASSRVQRVLGHLQNFNGENVSKKFESAEGLVTAETNSGGSHLNSGYSTITWDSTLGKPKTGQPHLMPFLLPTKYCDSNHKLITEQAKAILGSDSARVTTLEAAVLIRRWIRENIIYVLDKRSVLASETLQKREGMCTNKANLQIALCRAVGIPAGYCLVHISKNAYEHDPLLDEVFHVISDPTIHCYCAIFDEKRNKFVRFDATEQQTLSKHHNLLLDEDEETGETYYKEKYVVGPSSPVQSNIDSLLDYKPKGKIKIYDSLRKRQNDLYRKHYRKQSN